MREIVGTIIKIIIKGGDEVEEKYNKKKMLKQVFLLSLVSYIYIHICIYYSLWYVMLLLFLCLVVLCLFIYDHKIHFYMKNILKCGLFQEFLSLETFFIKNYAFYSNIIW